MASSASSGSAIANDFTFTGAGGSSAIAQRLFNDRGTSGDVTFRLLRDMSSDDLLSLGSPPPDRPTIDLKAHRLVLEERSQRFRAMLQTSSNGSGSAQFAEAAPGAIVRVTDVAPDVFAALLEFLYCDRLPTSIPLLLDLRAVAERYVLTQLETLCVRSLVNKACLDVGDSLSIVLHAQRGSLYSSCGYHDSDVVPIALKILVLNFEQVLERLDEADPGDVACILSCLAGAALFSDVSERGLVSWAIGYTKVPSDVALLNNDKDGNDASSSSATAHEPEDAEGAARAVDVTRVPLVISEAGVDFLSALLPFFGLGPFTGTHQTGFLDQLSDVLPSATASAIIAAVASRSPNSVVTTDMLQTRAVLNESWMCVCEETEIDEEGRLRYAKEGDAGAHRVCMTEAGMRPLCMLDALPASAVQELLLVLQHGPEFNLHTGCLSLFVESSCPRGRKHGDSATLALDWCRPSGSSAPAAAAVTDAVVGTAIMTATLSTSGDCSRFKSSAAAALSRDRFPIGPGSMWRVVLERERVVTSVEAHAGGERQVHASRAAAAAGAASESSSASSSAGQTAGNNSSGAPAASPVRYQLTITLDLQPVLGPWIVPPGHAVSRVQLSAQCGKRSHFAHHHNDDDDNEGEGEEDAGEEDAGEEDAGEEVRGSKVAAGTGSTIMLPPVDILVLHASSTINY